MLHVPPSRRIQRKLLGSYHRSSYPFLSGDTFRDLCKTKIDKESDIRKLFNCDSTSQQVFVAAGVASKLSFFVELNPQLDLSECKLIIHNGDIIPTESEFSTLLSRFIRVYSVNWLGDSSMVTPLPIGLENWSYYQNGVPSDFHNVNQSDEKRIEFLLAYSDHTFQSERSYARKIFREIPGTYEVVGTLSSHRYQDLVKQSKYVVSPPGNGADCHRTWEALYLGATPIVLKKFWPNFHGTLPVVAVEKWEDTLKNILEFEDIERRRFTSFADFSRNVFRELRCDT